MLNKIVCFHSFGDTLGTRLSLKESGTQGSLEKAHFKMFFWLRKKRISFSAPLIKDFDQTFSTLILYVQRTHKWTCLSLFREKKIQNDDLCEGEAQSRLVLLPAGNEVTVVRPMEVGRILPTFF